MQRAAVLEAASAAVADRGLNYGKPEDNFARIARLWNAHLVNRGLIPFADYGLAPADVALMLGNVKQARLANDSSHADSWIDLAGYAACGAEVSRAANDDVSQAPESKYGFTVGETVNLDVAPSGILPGTVVGFSTVGVDVHWWHWPAGTKQGVRANDLRHGP